MKKAILQRDLERIADVVMRWNVNKSPEFRAFKCGNCLKEIKKAWHYWFSFQGVRCEVHLCDLCYNLLLK